MLVIILGLILIFFLILDISIWDVIPEPKNKVVFWVGVILSLAVLILSSMPSLVVERPSGMHRGNLMSDNLRLAYLQEKTYVSSFAFGVFILMIASSPFWYRRNPKVSNKDLFLFFLSVVVEGGILLVILFPEIIIGQMVWPGIKGEDKFVELAEYGDKRSFLMSFWVILALHFIVRGLRISDRVKKVYS